MPGDVTRLLRQWSEGEEEAFDRLVPLVYEELRDLAGAHLRHERPDHSLDATGLVHEAYLRLVDRPTGAWESRKQFYAVAAQVIRRVLVDHARARLRLKRGGGRTTTLDIDPAVDWPLERSVQIADLDEALATLGELDSVQRQIVELRFFTGLTIEETADVLDISAATVKRAWKSARAWLLREMRGPDTGHLGTPSE